MKIVRKRTHTVDISLKSVNELFFEEIKSSFGPELVLQDNTIVIFNSSVAYFSLIGDGCITTSDIDLDTLKFVSNKYVTDDVARCKFENKLVINATVYDVYGCKVYVLGTKK